MYIYICLYVCFFAGHRETNAYYGQPILILSFVVYSFVFLVKTVTHKRYVYLVFGTRAG